MELVLSDSEKQALLRLARESIAARFENRGPELPEPSEAMRAVCGAFVTLRGRDGALRGCIGSISGHGPLFETIKDMATASAFHDPRFEPLAASELAGVRMEISVLSPMQLAADPAQVKVGLHGVYIKRGFRSGLLLPQVPGEQGWGLQQFLTHACYKAGLPAEAWREPGTEIHVFTALVFSEPR